jgi:hypothetical protein
VPPFLPLTIPTFGGPLPNPLLILPIFLLSVSFSYNGYLAPHSPSELNIDHNLRGELVAYVTKNLPEAAAAQREAALKLSTNANDLTAAGQLPQPVGQTMHASQLQTMLRMYERIQTYIFRLMATDSVPKVPFFTYPLPYFCSPSLFARSRYV